MGMGQKRFVSAADEEPLVLNMVPFRNGDGKLCSEPPPQPIRVQSRGSVVPELLRKLMVS